MIRSMTGYGKSVTHFGEQKIVVEIRSLNSKQLDINMRIPPLLRGKELELRRVLRDGLQRGKIDFSVSWDTPDETEGPVLNKALARHYYRQLQSFVRENGMDEQHDYLSLIVRLPDVFVPKEQELETERWEVLFSGVKEAVADINRFREHEGEILEKDFRTRIHNILQLLGKVDAYEQARIDRVKERIVKSLQEHLSDVQYDKNRLEQELIYYLEKFDVTEEKVRLKKHCDYFLTVMETEEAAGKKLAFVLQEIGREINTLGSKANDANMQKIVVLMKDELEKIKEQMLNIL